MKAVIGETFLIFRLTTPIFVNRPLVIMVVFLVVFQLFLAHFVFRNRDFPDITVTVDNRYIYTLPLYFLRLYTPNNMQIKKRECDDSDGDGFRERLEESMADSSKPTVEDAAKVILTENDVPAASGFF